MFPLSILPLSMSPSVRNQPLEAEEHALYDLKASSARPLMRERGSRIEDLSAEPVAVIPRMSAIHLTLFGCTKGLKLL